MPHRGADGVDEHGNGGRVTRFGQAGQQGAGVRVGPLLQKIDLGEAPGQSRHQLGGGRTQTTGDLHGTPGVAFGVQRCHQAGQGSYVPEARRRQDGLLMARRSNGFDVAQTSGPWAVRCAAT